MSCNRDAVPRRLEKPTLSSRSSANSIAFLSGLTHILLQQDPPRLGRCFGSVLRTPAGYLFLEPIERRSAPALEAA
jgi:hypothetical protein